MKHRQKRLEDRLRTDQALLLWRAKPTTAAAIAPMTSADPATARDNETGLPCVKVCRITAPGKVNDPSVKASATKNRVRTVNAVRSRTTPKIIITMARPIQWEGAST